MRPIKFRAWDNDMGNWTDAFYLDGNGQIFADTTPYSDKPDIKIMQFTGLLDKNGKEIYEGDICRAGETDIIFPVEWSIDQWVWWGSMRLSLAVPHNLEVIGNVYENKELL